jgi:hypothetical protein
VEPPTPRAPAEYEELYAYGTPPQGFDTYPQIKPMLKNQRYPQ